MVNRVLIDSERVRVSMPGIDVNTAKLDQLAFDSSFGSMRVHESGLLLIIGRICVGIRSEVPGSDHYIWAGGNATAFFSKSYPSPPVVMAACISNYLGAAIHPYLQSNAGVVAPWGPFGFAVQATSTSVTIYNYMIIDTGHGTGSQFSQPYAINLFYWAALI